MSFEDHEPVGPGRVEGSAACRVLFVIPRSTLDRHQGGGQRTAAIFEALRRISPPEVIVLGHAPYDDVWMDFPGAASIRVWPEFDLSEGSSGRTGRFFRFLKKYFSPRAYYKASAELERRLGELVAGELPSVVLFRLFPPYAISNLKADRDRGLFIVVDVDDRDDQKADTRLRSLFGDRVVDRVLAPVCIRPLGKLFSNRLRQASETWFVALEDASIPGVSSRVIENAAFAVPRQESLTLPSECRDILFVGPAFFHPNPSGVSWFLKECWPEILRQSPRTRFRIAGGGDWSRHLDGVEGRQSVDVLGFVEDMGAEYRNSRLFICPLDEGGGSKVKLIEACAFGRPVVATSHSMRGFSGEMADHVTKADSADAFVRGCLHFLSNDRDADFKGRELQAVQDRFYSRQVVMSKMTEAVQALIAS